MYYCWVGSSRLEQSGKEVGVVQAEVGRYAVAFLPDDAGPYAPSAVANRKSDWRNGVAADGGDRLRIARKMELSGSLARRFMARVA